MQPGSATFGKPNDKEKKIVIILLLLLLLFPTNLLAVWVKHFQLRKGHLTSL